MSRVCNKTSNNKYFNCPARMDDGRHFTDYRPNTYVNSLVRYGNNVMTNESYRQFLIKNANELMRVNALYTEQKNGCNECDAVPIPFETKCVVNQRYSTCYPDNCNGLGIKYNTEFIAPLRYNPTLQKKY